MPERSAPLADLALVLAAALLVASLWTTASAPSITREALRSGFDMALEQAVMEWDPGDPRPKEARRQALFDSNVVTQAVAGDVDTIVGEKVGLVLWRSNPLGPAFGMAPHPDASQPLRWTVNCLVCHTASIDGVAYFGAGAKTFDELWLGNALKRLTNEPWRSRLSGSPDYGLAVQAHRILTSHSHEKIESMTRGRSTAFAASHVELYMRSHDGQMPAVGEVGRGDVKTPPLWHTAAKMQRGRWYADGSFHGRIPLMASSMELAKDRSFDALVRLVIPVIKSEFDASSDTSGLHPIRMTSTGASPIAAASSSTPTRRGALPATVSTMAAGTWSGRGGTSTWVRTAHGAGSSRTGSSQPSTTAPSRRKGPCTGAQGMPPRR